MEKAIGWVRDKRGKVIRYKFHEYSNCLTSMCGGGHVDPETGMGNTTPYILKEYV